MIIVTLKEDDNTDNTNKGYNYNNLYDTTDNNANNNDLA
jgi:hypothetical protein